VNTRVQKKTWKRPQLTVLVRIDLAESVLQTCKYTNRGGPTSRDNVCYNQTYLGIICQENCQTHRST